MRIALIFPRVLNFTFPPLGVLYVAAVLKKEGHDTMVCDIDWKNKETMFGKIRQFAPSVVGLSFISAIQKDFVGSIIEELKPVLPRAYFVCGGVCAYVFSRYLLEDLGADAVIKGEGEETFKELIRNLEVRDDISGIRGIIFRKNGKITETIHREPLYNLDGIPFPARDLVDFERYLRPPGVLRGMWFSRSTTMLATRGCPSQCIFCSSHLVFGRTPRRRSAENIISEIKCLISDYNIDGIWFVDDSFTLDKVWVIELCDKIRKEQVLIKWGCQTRVNTLDFEMLKAMKEAGCLQVDFGVESGSLSVLKALKKEITPEMTQKAFALCKKLGIRTLAGFMVGNPQEKSDDIEMTSRLSRSIRADFTIFYFTTAYPGTELFGMAERNNWLRNKDYSSWSLRDPPALEINFRQKELAKIRSRLQNRFIIRNTVSSIKDPVFFKKMIFFLFLNIPAFAYALKILMQTGNFEDFTFSFIERSNKVKI